jgi:predicted RNase H-like HicB family nuclease
MGKDSRDIIRELEADGWRHVGATGSHHHFKAPEQTGQDHGAAPTEGLASKDGKIDLSTGRISRTAEVNMSGYIALVHKDEGTSYGVSFPDVPGCISAGDTFEDAIENAAEALAGRLALMRADGDMIPSPRSFEEVRRDPSFADDAADAIVTVVQPQRTPAEA